MDEALHAAAGSGKLDIARWLLSGGANARHDMRTNGSVLKYATAGGHLEMVKLLLDNMSGEDGNPARGLLIEELEQAAASGYFDIAKLLCDSGAQVNCQKCRFGEPSPLQAAAAAGGHFDIVKLLLERGADVDHRGIVHGRWTSLQAAAHGGYLDTVKLLVKWKAEVNAKGGGGGMRRMTALEAAASGGHVQVANFLLQNGANISDHYNNYLMRDIMFTALEWATMGGHYNMAKLLLSNKAVVDNLPHQTALSKAVSSRDDAMVELLMAHGAADGGHPTDHELIKLGYGNMLTKYTGRGKPLGDGKTS